MPKMYDDLAKWWPLLSAPEGLCAPDHVRENFSP
jgi:hypothetical protein